MIALLAQQSPSTCRGLDVLMPKKGISRNYRPNPNTTVCPKESTGWEIDLVRVCSTYVSQAQCNTAIVFLVRFCNHHRRSFEVEAAHICTSIASGKKGTKSRHMV